MYLMLDNNVVPDLAISNMLQSNLEKIIKEFCKFFGATVETLNFENDKIPEIKIKENAEVLKGYRNLISAVTDVYGKSSEETVVHDQWIEYAVTNAAFLQNSSNIPHILKELNDYMSDKVYFVGYELGPADILIYYFIYDIMLHFTFQEKEKYMNISRWFNNIQQDQKLRSWRNCICFSRTRLYI